jgi:hypothetical protein
MVIAKVENKTADLVSVAIIDRVKPFETKSQNANV